MDIISCDGCGALFDKNKVGFPEAPEWCPEWGYHGHKDIVQFRPELGEHGEHHIVKPCPVCIEPLVGDKV